MWEDNHGGGDSHLFGARVTAEGDILDPAAVSRSLGGSCCEERAPAVASDGENFFVVYAEDSFDWDLYGTRVDSDGSVIDPSGVPISTADGDRYSPGVAFDGANYLVVWDDDRTHQLRHLRRPGTPQARSWIPEGIAVGADPGASQEFPAVAWSGTHFYLVT